MNKLHFFIISILLIITGCSDIEQSKKDNQISPPTDSISYYLNEGKNLDNSTDKKLIFLHKAYLSAIEANTDSLKGKYLSFLSLNFPWVQDSALYRKLNKQTIAINYKLKDSLALGNAYWDLGFFLENKSVKDSAFFYYSEAQKIFQYIDNKSSSGQLLLNMATIQMQIKDYTGGEATTIKAIEQFKLVNDYLQLHNAYNLLGIILGDLGDYKKSLSYYNDALFYLKKVSYSSIDEARIINNIGVIYRKNKQYPLAIENFKKVVTIDSILLKDPSLYGRALSNLATAKLYNKDTTGIKELFNETIKIKSKENEIGSLASTYYSLAEYNAYANDTIEAILNAKNAEKLSMGSSSNELLLETWQLLSLLEKENADEYFKKYTTLNDSLQKEERKIQNKFARIRFETDEFIAENVELTDEKEVLSKQKQLWIGIAAGFFLLGLSIYIIINQRAKNQKLRFDQQQQANNQEIFNLMLTQKQKVDEVKRLEQKRISEELHDGVLGKMLGARMVLTGLNKRSTEEAIQEKTKALGSLQEIEHEIRSISHELSHSAYQKITNFTDSIDALLANHNKNMNIETFFHYNDDENWDSLEGAIKINVYRIIQETFQNAIKHANCSSFEITFYRNDDIFNVIMSDNGRGFNVNKGKKGIGLRNITSRINKLNGTFQVDSSENSGTTINLQIPLKKESYISSDNNAQIKNV
ncbi:tetratricopeptide repeat-containing sensor histidine kinase [Maribacter hydrothermalis]|uniref:histidine kinase n=1 Tax=Maribacter hydrothermalis TaxID=1836467 RepID=A0A1B7Z812_9FLAO|nr:tetratricopeptide repeat-containing sensor histidine kinase [Maribacter hydrothermalis]APQ19138.1 hypothetical protein BTR34_18220 [Maribacter hydrothermalis]OBR38851.1 hypothetical protein A9200_04065 [Maribacter hydrothermalis]